METLQATQETPTNEVPSSKPRRIGSGYIALILLVVVGVAGTFLAVKVRSSTGPPPVPTPEQNPLLDPSRKDESRARAGEHAVALAIGMQRKGDTMFFGEFVMARILKTCPSLNRAGIYFLAIVRSRYDNGAYRWDINASYIGSEPEDCSVQVIPNPLAGVWSHTGEVFPVESESNGAIFRGSTGGRPPVVPKGRPNVQTWLDDFRAGAAP